MLRYFIYDLAGSSNGRTLVFGTSNLGSSPSPATITIRYLSTKSLQSNIWKFAIHSITSKRTYMTFLTIFFLTMPNATARMIGMISAAGQIAGFLFEIPSGYISDRIGHKNALVFAKFLTILSTLCYILANSIAWFFVGGILMAIGIAFLSGTANAFMHDTLNDLGKGDQYAHVMGRIKSLGFAVPIIFILLLPVIAQTNFRLAFLVVLLLDIVGLFVVMSFKKPAASSIIEEVSIGNLKKTFRDWYKAGWVRYVLVGVISFGISFGAVAGFKNPYQELIGFSISSLGILWAISRVFISGISLWSGFIYKKISYKDLIILRATGYSICFLVIGLFPNMWITAGAFIIVTVLQWGLGAVFNQHNLDFIKTSNSKATLLSVNSLIEKMMSAIIALAMGFIVAGYSYMVGYLFMGIALLTLVVVSFFYLPKNSY